MQPSKRLDQIPPYMFAQLERKIAEKKAAGVDVISLGIGDPDTPTYAPIVAAAQAAVAHVLRGGAGLGGIVSVVLDGGELEVEVADDLHVNLTGWAVPVYAGSLSDDFLKELHAID